VKVLLITKVADLGAQGDVVDVADGYARNYLLPGGKAVKASAASVAAVQQAASRRKEAEAKIRQEAEDMAAGLVGTRVVLAAQAGDEGRLYGSVSVADVVEGIRKFTGIELDRKVVALAAPIREIGLHEVLIKLHPEVEFPLTIDVIPA
jgi:large subunit ribosomal protein L9